MNRSQRTRQDISHSASPTADRFGRTARAPGSERPRPPGGIALGIVGAWSAALVMLSILWGTGVIAAPFGVVRPDEYSTVLDHLPVPVGALLIGGPAAIGLVAAVLLLFSPQRRGRVAGAVGLFAAVYALVAAVLFTDTLLLAYFGYTVSFTFVPIPARIIWQAVFLVAPAVWVVVWTRLESQNREAAGQALAGGETLTTEDDLPLRPSRGAKVAVGLALVAPVTYAFTRILWALGIPIGLSSDFFDEGAEMGAWNVGLVLALAGLAGCLLTLGLVQRWGEVVPKWAGPLAGRRVPITLATIPATIVSLALLAGGAGVIREGLLGGIGIVGEWATAGPTYLFPLWAIALAWATYLYRSRRLRSEAMARALGRKPAQAATETTGRDAASPA